jgi:hypothetical protein
MNFDLNLIMYKIKSYDMVQMFVNFFVKEKKKIDIKFIVVY